jgi:glutamate racemase
MSLMPTLDLFTPLSAPASGAPLASRAAPAHPGCAPIGVFDSGVGGLSVLQALRQELPQEDFVYLADSAQAPYGEREPGFVAARSLAIAHYLQSQFHIKALVVACNTATAAAVELLRLHCRDLPIIGVEPALKPAVALSATRRIGVVATQGTLGSDKFRRLLGSLAAQADFVLQACDGLAWALERSVAHGMAETEASAQEIAGLIDRHVSAMGDFGSAAGQIDTLVLGCTHYPFAEQLFQARVGAAVRLLDTGAPVARHGRKLLQARDLLQPDGSHRSGLTLLSSGDAAALRAAAQRWLQLPGAQAHGVRLPD